MEWSENILYEVLVIIWKFYKHTDNNLVASFIHSIYGKFEEVWSLFRNCLFSKTAIKRDLQIVYIELSVL